MSAKVEVCGGEELAVIGGRPVLQPACNRVARANEANNGKPMIRKPIKPPPPAPKPVLPTKLHCNQNVPSKPQSKSPSSSPPLSPSAKTGLLTIPSKNAVPRIQSKSPAISKQNAVEDSPAPPSDTVCKEASPAPTLKLSHSQSKNKPVIKPSSQRTLLKRANDTGSFNVSADKQSANEAVTPKAASPKAASSVAMKISIDGRKKSRKLEATEASLLSTKPPGSFAAARKAEMSEIYAQRKLKIAHYGRKQGMPKAEKVVPEEIASAAVHSEDIKRCSFITSQSDPAYITYHDEEWGVPVHDDKLLFELLVLMGAQVGMNWPTILSKRESFRDAFAGFDPAIVAGFSEKKIGSISAEHDIMDVAKIRGMVENAKQILEIVQEFGSFDKYIWSFVNYKPIVNKYRHGRHIPVKTSKAETISKDLVKRNFRFVGPTITYSFMQAAGLTNDHLVNCFRHEECLRLSEQGSCN
ncbi:hypothetical protein SUGI_0819320 [Cryptomeria japonica]|uniref:uncharacterized protein LOC131078972 n=1 Tax=Cryptomeria japonica TaxID=3369 RepID=UPI002414BA0E|nr:uncharacterized protein LOC131078972 [Cryptomeria japonica]GLJ40024.1 hypothetical protein SUGI_0819320 [Cryptomeria japonica]